MGGGGDDPGWAPGRDPGGLGRQPFGQMHAVGPDPRRKFGVRPDQQEQPARPGDRRQALAAGLGVRGAEGPVDDPGAARQAGRDRLEIGGAGRIGEEQQGRQGLSPALTPG